MIIPEVEELKAALRSGAAIPAVLVTGDDQAVREAVVEAVRDGARVVRVDASSTKSDAWQRFFDACSTMPMFMERVVFVVEGHDGVTMPKELESFLASPPSHVRLLLCTERKAPGLAKAVEAIGGRVVAVGDLNERQAKTVVEACARQAGIAIGRAAVEALVDLVGPDRAAIETAVRALLAYKGTGARIGEADLMGLVQRTRQVMPWDLPEAINSRDLKTAIKIACRELEDNGKEAVMGIFHRVTRQARLLLRALELVKRNASDEEAMAALNMKAYPWTKLRDAAKRWKASELRAFLLEAPSIEQLAKRTQASPEAVITHMLVRLISRKA